MSKTKGLELDYYQMCGQNSSVMNGNLNSDDNGILYFNVHLTGKSMEEISITDALS